MEEILQYIRKLINPVHPILVELEAQHRERKDILPCIERETAQLLSLFVQLTGAKRVLELGTCIGYSAIWLGTALQKTGGKLITVEYFENLYQEASQNVQKAGLSDTVQVIYGDVTEVINEVAGPFDIIFQDSRKNLYAPMLEKCIALVRSNGLIIADDTLLSVTNKYPRIRKAVHAYNEKVFQDKRLYTTLIPVGDGLTVSVKL